MFYLITACVLVIVVQLGVAVAWHTWWRTSLRQLQHSSEFVQLKLDRSSLGQLRVELDALAAGVEKLGRSCHKRFGTLWAELESRRPRNDVGAAFVDSGDPELVKMGEALNELGVNRAARTGVTCQCGWCASCLERANIARGTQ